MYFDNPSHVDLFFVVVSLIVSKKHLQSLWRIVSPLSESTKNWENIVILLDLGVGNKMSDLIIVMNIAN
jgi:hypothetical protein